MAVTYGEKMVGLIGLYRKRCKTGRRL